MIWSDQPLRSLALFAFSGLTVKKAKKNANILLYFISNLFFACTHQST